MLRRSSLHASFVFVLAVFGLSGLVHCSSEDEPAADGSSSGTAGDGGNGTSSSSGATSGSSSGSSGGNLDGGADATKPPRCDPSKPFVKEMKLLEGSFRIDQSARLTSDELTLFYAGYGHDGFNGQTELWVATRASTDVPFKDPKKISELSTGTSELYPAVTGDGLTMYYLGTLPTGDAGYGVLKSTRTNTSQPWNPPTMFIAGTDLSMLHVTHDGTRLYGTKDLPGGPPTTTEIRYVDIPYDGSPPKVLAIMPSGGQKYWPILSADALTLYYSYPRTSPFRWELGSGKRASVTDPFTSIARIAELDIEGGADEQAMWISEDNCVLYFQRGNANIPDNAAGFIQATRGF